MADSGGTRKLTVTACNPLHSGVGKNNKPWTIFEVFAVDESGATVEAKLRSFDALTLNKLVEYEVERREDARHGTSYMLKKPGRREPPVDPRVLELRITELRESHEALVERVKAAEDLVVELLAFLKAGSQSGDRPLPELKTQPAASSALADGVPI